MGMRSLLLSQHDRDVTGGEEDKVCLHKPTQLEYADGVYEPSSLFYSGQKKREHTPPPLQNPLPSRQNYSSIWASIALLSAFCFLSQNQSLTAPPFLARERLAAPRPLPVAR